MRRAAPGQAYLFLGASGAWFTEPLRAVGAQVRTRRRLFLSAWTQVTLDQVWPAQPAGRRGAVVVTDGPMIGLVAWGYSRWRQWPLVVLVRGDAWAENQRRRGLGRWVWAAILPWYRRMLGEAAAVVALSHALGDRLVKHQLCRPEQLTVIHRAIDLTVFGRETPAEARRRWQLPDGELLLSASNFGLWPKVAGLIDWLPAMAELLAARPAAHWLIAGRGPHLSEFRQALQRELGPLSERAHILDWVTDMASLYAAADLVVHFSGLDTLPRVLLEAQAAGRPVITNAVGGVAEAVRPGETGYVVLTQAAFLTAAESLLQNPEHWRAVSTQAQAFMAAEFSPAAVGGRWSALLRRCAALETL